MTIGHLATRDQLKLGLFYPGQRLLHLSNLVHVGHVDVACAVPSRVTHLDQDDIFSHFPYIQNLFAFFSFCHLVSKGRAIRFLSKVNTEVVVQLHSSVLRVAINYEHH